MTFSCTDSLKTTTSFINKINAYLCDPTKITIHKVLGAHDLFSAYTITYTGNCLATNTNTIWQQITTSLSSLNSNLSHSSTTGFKHITQMKRLHPPNNCHQQEHKAENWNTIKRRMSFLLNIIDFCFYFSAVQIFSLQKHTQTQQKKLKKYYKKTPTVNTDRKSTRLNSSHTDISR